MSLVQLNLAEIPAPTIIEALDYETILAQKLARIHTAMPNYLPLESDPAYKMLEIIAYDELLLRQRVNDAAKGVMLAFAVGSDLDNIGARYDVKRLEGEDDARLRIRIQQGYHLLAAAGPVNAYKQHAMGVSAQIVDVSVVCPIAGRVVVTVFAQQLVNTLDASQDEIDYGMVAFRQPIEIETTAILARHDSSLLERVRLKLNAEDIRPLTDHVVVQAPTVRPFEIQAALTIHKGPDPSVVLNNSKARLNDYLLSIRRLGFDATRAGIIGALMSSGVQNVILTKPITDLILRETELALAMELTLSVVGIGD